MKIFSGNSNRLLSECICDFLGISLGKASVKCFSDKEISVEIEENVRGEDVFIVQSTSCPANDYLMELLIMIDAVRRSSAKRITAVIPYFGYCRQDRKHGSRTPISAKLVANLITKAGADRVMTLDLHAGQVQGFFDIPTDNLYALPIWENDIKSIYEASQVMAIAPDVGGVVRTRALAKRLNCSIAIVDKRRESPGKIEIMNVIGKVKGKDCVLIDDIVDTAGTLCGAAEALYEQGASSVTAYITHGVLSAPAIERILSSKLEKIVITDSIQPTQLVRSSSKIRIVTVAHLLGEAIQRTCKERSISSLFD
ncbi:MAG: ribose-phosphate pyrophosphokinase [Candidatus Liberibacter ctenarytainae]|uniref:Ribose-phosphate pyrophosphokinase n=1 Tax=Candidatus Liberibacter ctenarytainae TaxID=2020335 RepID=A0A937DLV9_9HYPH|nr:ribose-phosphate pyrophosphokinase [Candidatus Liberibacter ctenarytainae]